jgi:hypothetical protein
MISYRISIAILVFGVSSLNQIMLLSHLESNLNTILLSSFSNFDLLPDCYSGVYDNCEPQSEGG